ncbi:MAG: hypothetical protein ACLUR5_12595 [Eubacterium ventriosum]
MTGANDKIKIVGIKKLMAQRKLSEVSPSSTPFKILILEEYSFLKEFKASKYLGKSI